MDIETPVNPCVVPAHWNLFQRINWVRSQLWYVQKTATVQNYKAVTHDMVTAMLRPHLMRAGIVVFPSVVSGTTVNTGAMTKSGMPIVRYEADFNVRFVNSETPEDMHIIQTPAHANDQGDKAPAKATSMAVKVALLKMFSLETGEDEESRIEAQFKPAELITEEQSESLLKQINDNGIDLEKFMTWLAGPPVKAKTMDSTTVQALPLVQKQLAAAIKRKAK